MPATFIAEYDLLLQYNQKIYVCYNVNFYWTVISFVQFKTDFKRSISQQLWNWKFLLSNERSVDLLNAAKSKDFCLL